MKNKIIAGTFADFLFHLAAEDQFENWAKKPALFISGFMKKMPVIWHTIRCTLLLKPRQVKAFIPSRKIRKGDQRGGIGPYCYSFLLHARLGGWSGQGVQ